MKKLLIISIGVLSLVYLLNPGFGIFELIPDGIPFIGNLDEASASILLASSLTYFGLDLRDVFRLWWRRK